MAKEPTDWDSILKIITPIIAAGAFMFWVLSDRIDRHWQDHEQHENRHVQLNNFLLRVLEPDSLTPEEIKQKCEKNPPLCDVRSLER